MQQRQLIIIGGGPAGLAAALGAYDSGVRDILILEREREVGGILNQCIHNGFGLHTFKEELTGPEYAARYAERVTALPIEVLCSTAVISVNAKRQVTAVSAEKGLLHFSADAVILAAGCRERPRGAVNVAGARCAGIYAAGAAQKLVNLYGYMPGSEAVILGSGDIGLIMARRMTFEGAKVKAVVELMPYSGGLNRNIVQCLHDFDIPLYLSHTVTDIEGDSRVTAVTIAKVDGALKPIKGTEQRIECDTLLLSVGLLPENELARGAGVTLSRVTGGAEVDETLMSVVPGIFACGNVLHVHDLVDYVSEESGLAGAHAAAFVLSGGLSYTPVNECIGITAASGVRYCVPQRLSKRSCARKLTLRCRVDQPYKNVRLVVSADGAEVYAKRRPVVTPGEMEVIALNETQTEALCAAEEIRIFISQREDA